MEDVDTDATESAFVDDETADFGTLDDQDGPDIGTPDEAVISPPDIAPAGVPGREDPATAARKAFRSWWDANAAFVDDDAELIGLLEWRAKVHQEIARRLYAERLALLIQWRSEGLTLQQIADRSKLSYARVYALMPKHLRGRRPAQDQGPDTPEISPPDDSTIRGTDSEPVAA